MDTIPPHYAWPVFLLFIGGDVKRLFRYAFIVLVVLLVIGSIALLVAYRATQHEPEFYVLALDIEPEQQAIAVEELERNVLDLRNEVRQEGRWEASFTDDQINGWLANELPKELPRNLPANVTDPRVSFAADLAQVAFRLRTERFASVISLGVSAQLGNQPNEVAVRIRSLRAGALPLPTVEDWKQKIEQKAIKSGIPFKWETIDGDHVAIVNLPQHNEQFPGRRLLLDTIQVREGEVYFAGRTESPEGSDGKNEVLQTADVLRAFSDAIQR